MTEFANSKPTLPLLRLFIAELGGIDAATQSDLDRLVGELEQAVDLEDGEEIIDIDAMRKQMSRGDSLVPHHIEAELGSHL